MTKHTAQRSKKIVEEQGVLSLPSPKAGHSLVVETVDVVHSFYQSDDISRVMPGMKDFVSVRKDCKRQKRLVLSNLKEAYSEFKQKFPDQKVGFSKFAELRPKHCILAGASGTHSVCVCTIHQNVKLIIFEMRLSDLPTYQLPTYQHCLARIIQNAILVNVRRN